jgi:hypothetical protein
MCRCPAMIVFGELRREAIVRFVELVQYGCFESFPFRQNFVIFVRQITWFRWNSWHWTSGFNVHNKNSNRYVNVRSSTLKNLNIFGKRQISIKLFYLYQRFQCRDKYFFKIKFVFFLYLRLSASSKENNLPLCIYFWYQTDSGYRTPLLIQRFPWRLHITITYNLPHLRLWCADVVTVIA